MTENYEQTMQLIQTKIAKFLEKYENGAAPKAAKELFLKGLARTHRISQDSILELFPKPPKQEREFTLEEQTNAGDLLYSPNLFEKFPGFLDPTDCVMAPWRAQALLCFIGMTLLRRVKFFAFFGDTGDGKTKAAETMLKLLDYENSGEKYVKAMEVSPKWLKYAGGSNGEDLVNKVLFIDEVNPPKPGEDDSIQKLLRQLDNEDAPYAVYHSVDEMAGSGRGASKTILKLPIYVLITTITKPESWDEQNKTRFIWTEFGLTPKEVTEINRRSAKPSIPSQQKATIFRTFNCFLANLLREDLDKRGFAEIVIPFMEELVPEADKYSSGADCRRFKILQDFIKASAILHQCNRETYSDDACEYLVASREDYENVKDIFERIVPRSHSLVGEKHVQDFKTIFWSLFDSTEALNIKQISLLTGVSERRLETSLKRLIHLRWLTRTQEKMSEGDRYYYYKLSKAVLDLLPAQPDRSDSEFDLLISKLQSAPIISAKGNDGLDILTGLKKRACSAENQRSESINHESE